MTPRTSRLYPLQTPAERGRRVEPVHPLDRVLPFLPPEIGEKLCALPHQVQEDLEEIRFRAGRPLEVVLRNGDGFLGPDGQLTLDPVEGWVVSPDLVARMVELLVRSSFYAVEEDLRQGFLTLPGGHRVGLVGRVVLGRGEKGAVVQGLRSFSGVNLRLAREVLGVADKVLRHLFEAGGRPVSTLIISPPRGGKTTLLRDLARQLSDGVPQLGWPGGRVAIVDERSELAGCEEGIPQYQVGVRTDVLDGCPKAQGIMMLIRSMSPEVIITDEIGREEDVTAVQEACHAGVVIMASAHAAGLEDALRRPVLRRLLKGGHFGRVVVLSRRLGPGTLEGVVEVTKLVKPGREEDVPLAETGGK